jgi:hypothetical protein
MFRFQLIVCLFNYNFKVICRLVCLVSYVRIAPLFYENPVYSQDKLKGLCVMTRYL